MKNVLVFALGGGRYAIELRWVREIFTLGHLTPVPTAPPAISGVVSFQGAIVPVLWGAPLLEASGAPRPAGARSPQSGDALVLLDADGVRAALAIDRVDAVTTLSFSERGLVDARGEGIPLVDAPTMVAQARAQVGAAAAGVAAMLAGEGGHGPRE